MSSDTPAPRRSTRTQAPKPHPQPRTPVKARKPIDRDEQLRVLLYSPKSALVNVDMVDLINASTFTSLPPAVRAELALLLPPTAFHDFVPFLAATHPSLQQESVAAPSTSTPTSPASSRLNSSIFTSPHFLSAVRTFQDHLYTGWRMPTHTELVRKYKEGVDAGTISVPWKDEAWADTHAEEDEPAGETVATAAASMECRLSDLAGGGFLKVGDILAFKHRFAAHRLTIEKDILISSISMRNHTVTAIIAPGPQRDVPTQTSPSKGKGHAAQTPSVTVASPTHLENEVLNADGRIPRDGARSGNAWKAITVWRLHDGDGGAEGVLDGRGSRESCGTLFYLRSCYFAEQS
ncbi:hypothetical protein FA95DRAFT_1506575 [Auriscalpium vulgare]|uniref:Uncharacterized protein n=1 Tax=Auriscalpium vulgare TaxID=40419 RepID=A0ACB8R1I7_9AGAM|nr:hypothetical protein FA95DRAFT_1506575 [Auriscalpium vulgare]